MQFEQLFRSNILGAARALEHSGTSFATFKTSRCNERLWILNEDGGFQLRSEVPPSVGIRDIFYNGRLYAFECATSMVIVMYKAALDTLGEDTFNRLFTNLRLRDWHYDSDLRLIQRRGVSTAKPGDILYFKNPDVNPERMEWQGENTIYLGPDLYYGHGLGTANAATVIRALNDRRRPGARRSAYLTNTVTHPDFNYLSTYMQGNPNYPGMPPADMRDADAVQARIGCGNYIVG